MNGSGRGPVPEANLPIAAQNVLSTHRRTVSQAPCTGAFRAYFGAAFVVPSVLCASTL